MEDQEDNFGDNFGDNVGDNFVRRYMKASVCISITSITGKGLLYVTVCVRQIVNKTIIAGLKLNDIPQQVIRYSLT